MYISFESAMNILSLHNHRIKMLSLFYGFFLTNCIDFWYPLSINIQNELTVSYQRHLKLI